MKTWIAIAAVGVVAYLCGVLTPKRSPSESWEEEENQPVEAITLVGQARNSSKLPIDILGPAPVAGTPNYFEYITQLADQMKVEAASVYSSNSIERARWLVTLDSALTGTSEADIIAILEQEAAGQFPHVMLEQIFRRWGELAPERAFAAAMDRSQRTGKYSGFDGVMRAWVENDKEAARAWLESLPDEKVEKQSAEIGYLHALASIDPNGAIDYLVQADTSNFGNPYGMGEALKVLVASMDPGEFPALGSRILTETASGTTKSFLTKTLLDTWGAIEPQAALDWAFAQEPGAIQPDALSPAIRELTKGGDVATSIANLTPYLSQGEAFEKVAGELWVSWIQYGDDPEAALAWAKENAEHLKPPDYLHRGSYSSLEEDRALLLLEAIKELPEGTMKQAVSKSLIGAISRSNPKTALNFMIEHLPAGEDSSNQIGSTIANWAENGDPEIAIQWALDNLEPGRARQDAVRFAAYRWAEKDPERFATYSLTLPEKERNSALWGLADGWAQSNPDQVLAFIRSAENPETVNSLTSSVFWSFAQNREAGAYLEIALDMPSGPARNSAVKGLFSGWGHVDGNSAAEALSEMTPGPLRDTAIEGFITRTIFSDDRAAFAWATQISNPNKHRKQVLYTGKRWLSNDREGAEKWIREESTLDTEMVEELLRAADK